MRIIILNANISGWPKSIENAHPIGSTYYYSILLFLQYSDDYCRYVYFFRLLINIFRYMRHSGYHAFFDVTLVAAPKYSEQSVLAPWSTPRIGAQPILGTFVYAPAQDLDRVTTFHLTSRVTVHSFDINRTKAQQHTWIKAKLI